MEIHEIWRVARRQWPIVVGCTALALLLFASWSLIRPTAYEAHERLIVTTSGSLGTAVDAQSGEEVAILRVSGYQRMITGPAFLTRVAEKLKIVIRRKNSKRSCRHAPRPGFRCST